MSPQQKENHVTNIIDAVIKLKHSIDSLCESSGLIEIKVNHRAKHAIDYVFYDVSSFYCGKKSLHSPVELLAGVKLTVGEP